MNAVLLGIICGLVFGALDVLIMIPLKCEDQKKKKEAMIGAFLERYMLGFLIPNVNLPFSFVITGVILGLGLSLPTAVITRVYAPIIGIGIVGGIIIGLISQVILG